MRNYFKVLKLISNIMSKCHGIFTENVSIFFSNAGKTGNLSEFMFYTFKKIIYLRLYKW